MPRMHPQGPSSTIHVSVTATASSINLDAGGDETNQKNREGFPGTNKHTRAGDPTTPVIQNTISETLRYSKSAISGLW
ncbi:unnamed protein product [Alternaria alternata]